jgi:hypothetical protein
MSFDLSTEAPLRRVRTLRGYGALAAAIVLAVFLWIAPGGTSPIVNTIVILAIGMFGMLQLWRARRTSSDATVRLPPGLDPNSLPIDDRLRLFRRHLILCAVVCPMLSLVTAYDIHRLESGAERVSLWMPSAVLYDHFGYWTAVLAPIVFGAIMSVLLIGRLRRGN